MTTWGAPAGPPGDSTPSLTTSARPWSAAGWPAFPQADEQVGRWAPPLAADGCPLRQPGVVTAVRTILGIELGLAVLMLLATLAIPGPDNSDRAGTIAVATFGALLAAVAIGVPVLIRFGWRRFGAWIGALLFAVLFPVGFAGLTYELLVAPAQEGLSGLAAAFVGLPSALLCLIVNLVLLLLPSVLAYSRGRS